MEQFISGVLPRIVAFLSAVLQWITILLMVILTAVVTVAVIARLAGQILGRNQRRC